MKSIALDDFNTDDSLLEEAAALLRDGEGLVCFPCASTYRFGVNLLSEKAVMRLLQTKRRSGHHPALVMVANATMMEQVAEPIPGAALRVATQVWPGPVTLRLPLSKDLPRKVYKELSKPDGKVGLRMPDSPTASRLVQAAGVPVLVSSANRSRKVGAGSVALIRRQFAPSIDLFVEAGDLPQSPPSTVVDLDREGRLVIVRPGAISEAQLREALATPS